MKRNNWFNRFFFDKELREEKEKYRRLKTLLSKYPRYFDSIVNAKNLFELLELHKEIWKEGFRNRNIAPCEWGCFRTESIPTMKAEDVYFGNIYGLWTFNIPEWEKCKEEIMGPNGFGVPKDTKVYDLILDHYKCILKSNMNAIKNSALEYVSAYESINNDKDPYQI